MNELREYLLPVRLDDTPVPGLPENVGYIDLRHCAVEELARLVERKLGPEKTPEDIGKLIHRARAFRSVSGVCERRSEASPQHLERMLELFQTDADARVRAHSALALDSLRDPRTTEGLLSTLSDPEWDVRSHAGRELVHLGEAVHDVLSSARGLEDPRRGRDGPTRPREARPREALRRSPARPLSERLLN